MSPRPLTGYASRLVKIALSVMPFFIFLLLVPSHVSAQSAKSDTQFPASSYAGSSLELDDATDIHATKQLIDAVRSMVYAEDFDHLDALADSFRKKKIKFSGGMWKIHNFYGGTRPYGHATEEDWKTLEGILTRWVTANPKSITARVALAQMYADYAWSARGNGYTNTVSESGWRLFESRINQAREVLDSAKALPEMCPEWYLVMQMVARDQGWSKESIRELLRSAASFEPGYYYYYRTHTIYLLPKWDGEPGEAEQFIAQSADRVGGPEGDILYFRLASFLVNHDRDAFNKLSFDRIRRGFTQSERIYGTSLTNMNLFAYMAWVFNEAGVADPIFKRIGNQWSEDPFGSEDLFDKGKKWAVQFAEIFPDTTNAEENIKTPEGQRYNAEFRTKFAGLIQSCLGKADPTEGDVRLYAVIGQDGTINTLRVFGGNSQGPCLFQTTHQKLSPPSRAPFQILLTFKLPLQTAPK